MDYGDDERISPKTKIPELFSLIDQKEKEFIGKLKDAAKIPSASNSQEHTQDVLKMLQIFAEKLEALGAMVDIVDGNSEEEEEEEESNLPPVIFANLFVDDEYKTVCIYGNIDIILPTSKENKKRSTLDIVEKDGRLHGFGVSDNKGPLLCWFNALEIYKMSKNELPVNLKFVIEGTSELYSKSLSNAIKKKREFFNNVEYVCFTIDKRVNEKPCLKYGYRGMCNFSLYITCGDKKIGSGTYGGAFNQPLMDAINIFGTFFDKNRRITIQDFMNDIKPITKKELKLCETDQSVIEHIKKDIGVQALRHKDIPSRVILHKTFLPSLSINTFQITSEPPDKDDLAAIANKIKALFTVRLVPHQTVKRTTEQFHRHIEKQWNVFGSENKYHLKLKVGFNPWQQDPLSDHYKAAAAAIKTVFDKSPNYYCEGSTLPAVSILSKACPASNMIVMPISGHKDCHHSENESISITNYIQGIKLVIAYMCEVNEITYS